MGYGHFGTSNHGLISGKIKDMGKMETVLKNNWNFNDNCFLELHLQNCCFKIFYICCFPGQTHLNIVQQCFYGKLCLEFEIVCPELIPLLLQSARPPFTSKLWGCGLCQLVLGVREVLDLVTHTGPLWKPLESKFL